MFLYILYRLYTNYNVQMKAEREGYHGFQFDEVKQTIKIRNMPQGTRVKTTTVRPKWSL